MVLGTIWQLNEEWMAKRGTPVQKVGVEQKIAATVVIGTYIVGAYTMWVRLESWWLCFVGEIVLLLVSAIGFYMCKGSVLIMGNVGCGGTGVCMDG
jgi:hypothetical protein